MRRKLEAGEDVDPEKTEAEKAAAHEQQMKSDAERHAREMEKQKRYQQMSPAEIRADQMNELVKLGKMDPKVAAQLIDKEASREKEDAARKEKDDAERAARKEKDDAGQAAHEAEMAEWKAKIDAMKQQGMDNVAAVTQQEDEIDASFKRVVDQIKENPASFTTVPTFDGETGREFTDKEKERFQHIIDQINTVTGAATQQAEGTSQKNILRQLTLLSG